MLRNQSQVPDLFNISLDTDKKTPNKHLIFLSYTCAEHKKVSI